MEFCGEGEAVTVVIELPVAVGVAPGVFVSDTVAVVVVADVFIGKRDDLELHHGHLIGHPLAGVVVADNHHIVSVSVVAVVPDEGVVIAALHVLGDFHPG